MVPRPPAAWMQADSSFPRPAHHADVRIGGVQGDELGRFGLLEGVGPIHQDQRSTKALGPTKCKVFHPVTPSVMIRSTRAEKSRPIPFIMVG